ncbi:MAG: hypothetical protein ACLU9L_02940 [Christensenellales bacterium]
MAPDFKDFTKLIQGEKTEQMIEKAQKLLGKNGNDTSSIIACSLLLSVDLLGTYHEWLLKSLDMLD